MIAPPKATRETWREVRKDSPCPACGKPDWCAWSPDGAVLRCMRPGLGSHENGNAPAGMRRIKTDDAGWTLYAFDDAGAGRSRSGRVGAGLNRKPRATHGSTATFDLGAMVQPLQKQLTEEHLAALAKSTGVPAAAWAKLGSGWCTPADLRTLKAGGAGWVEPGPYPDGAYAFPEHDGRGKLVGLSLRAMDGRKGAPSGKATGCKRGIVVPDDLHDLPDPVLIVEGASDVAACVALGVAAVGRPSNRAGAADLADLLDGRDVRVVGERDGKAGGAWPGRDGAKAVAMQLAGRWGEPVSWTLPPAEAKDVRAWFMANPQGKAVALIEALQAAAKQVKPAKRSTADALVELALLGYRLGRTATGDAFAVERAGPAVALLFKGSASALRARLSRAYRATTGKTPNASALADALCALEGQAMDAEPEPVSLRLAEHDTDVGPGVVLDLGDAAGRAAVVDGDGVTVVTESPALFRRTALTGALPCPAEKVTDPAALAGLRELLNVTDDAWPLVVGYLVAACIPNIPHPVLMLGGEQGTGKSTAARLIIGLVDPSPAMLRSAPRDPEAWAMAAAGSWCVVIDNVSGIPQWWSDAMCKAVTGDGWVRRKLYSDSDLSVLTFKRCVVLTTIDAGALRGDLGDRLLLVDLDRIGDHQRLTEAELDRRYTQAKPCLLAALLHAVSRTLAKLPTVELDTMPRMADFARVLAAVDAACPELTGGRALPLFIHQRDRIAEDVIEGDIVAVAIVTLVDEHSGRWAGTAGDLLATIKPEKPTKSWPSNGRGIAGRLKRLTPALRQVGIDASKSETRSRRGTHYTLERVSKKQSQPSQPSPDASATPLRTIRGDGCPNPTTPTVTPTVTPQTPPTTAESSMGDGGDGGDGLLQHSSDASTTPTGWGSEGEL